MPVLSSKGGGKFFPLNPSLRGRFGVVEGISRARAGGGGVAIPPVDITAAGGSLRFPEQNLLTADPAEAAALIQPAVGKGAGFFAGDGALFAIVRLPAVRRFENYSWGIFGHSGNSNNRWALSWRGGKHNVTADRNKPLGYFRGNGGSIVSLLGAPCLEDGALMVLQKVGGNWSMDWYSLETGSINAGTPTAIASVAVSTFLVDFGVGHLATAIPTLTAISAGGVSPFPGELECVGFLDGSSQAIDWQDVALGADPLTKFGSANLKYFRRFNGTSADYAPASSGDTLADLVPWNAGNMRVGSHIRRKAVANFVTVNSKSAGHVFGLLPGQSSRLCAFSGKAGGYTGDVQIKVFSDTTGAVILDWTTVGTIVSGVWSGSVTLPKTTGWLNAQIRPMANTADVVEMREPFAVGYKFLLLGQSQMAIAQGASNPSFNGFPRKYRMSAMATDTNTVVSYRMGNFKLSDGMAYFEKQLAAFDAVTPVQLVWEAVVGTGMNHLMNDSESSRLWTDLQIKLDYGGNDFTSVIHQWATDDAGVDYIPRLEALFFNTGSAVSDHSLVGALVPGYAVAYSPPTRYSSSGLHDGPRKNGVEFALARGWTVGPYTSDMQIEDAGGPHQKPNVQKGSPLLGTRLGLAAAKAIGLTSIVYPSFSGVVTRSGATLTVGFTLPNGGSLYSPNSSDVKSFEVDDGGVGSWSATGFTAAVSGNSVVITKSAGNWSAGSKVRYRANLALRANGDGAAETAIIESALYETWAQDPLGLGLPMTPILAETVAT